jgi:hypothetical protein
MSYYYSCLENMMYDFYYQKDYRTALRIYDNIKDNEKELDYVEANANIVFSAIMDIEYKKNKSYFKKFADMAGETSILEDSGYCIYDLNEMYIIAKDGVSMRDWIYETELMEFSKKLNENKKKIKAAISELVVSSGVAMALLYTNYSQQCAVRV